MKKVNVLKIDSSNDKKRKDQLSTKIELVVKIKDINKNKNKN